jgi:hypothetical protein
MADGNRFKIPKIVLCVVIAPLQETTGSAHRNGYFTTGGRPAKNQPEFTCKPIYK